MIEFVHPALAWGALAGLLPIAIHLIDRRRARPHPFAAIDFVFRSRRSSARRLRLKRLLLLALRVLALVALPLALARPRVAAAIAPGRANALGGPRAVALLLDGSGSMNYRQGSTPLFERAQLSARARLASLPGDDSVTVGICAPRRAAPGAPSFERAAARAAIDGAVASQEPTDLSACLDRAAAVLAESPLANRRIVLFTDLTAADWDLAHLPPEISTSKGAVRPEVEVVDVGGGAMPNHALSELSVAPAPEVGPRAFRFSFTVHNFADQPIQNLGVSLRSGKELLARGFCDLAPHGSQRKSLAASFPEGARVVGSVSLEPDALAYDDALAFSIAVPRELRVLLVDGAPSTLRYRDEAFFAQTALAAASGIGTRTVDPESFSAHDLESSDVVFLLNVRSLPPELASAVELFVNRGGGLFIALGDRVDPEIWAGALGRLLPLPLRLVKTAAPPPREGEIAGEAVSQEANGLTGRIPAHFSNLDVSSPVFSPFGGASREGLLDAQIYRYYLTDPAVASAGARSPAARVIASFDDGAPALIEARRGLGRTMLFTSSVAREWSDWPIRSSFVPALQQIARWLADVNQERIQPASLVGQRRSLPNRVGLTPVEALSPSGLVLPVEPGADGGVSIAAPPEVGLYRLRAQSAEGKVADAPGLAFTVAPDPRESDTSRLKSGELAAWLGPSAQPSSLAPSGSGPRAPLWSWLLAAAALAFLLEGLLLRR